MTFWPGGGGFIHDHGVELQRYWRTFKKKKSIPLGPFFVSTILLTPLYGCRIPLTSFYILTDLTATTKIFSWTWTKNLLIKVWDWFDFIGLLCHIILLFQLPLTPNLTSSDHVDPSFFEVIWSHWVIFCTVLLHPLSQIWWSTPNPHPPAEFDDLFIISGSLVYVHSFNLAVGMYEWIMAVICV